ncbi:hypothetical protein [Candidatus Halobonum tyrrellensis]|uniref:Uncharacterized protein n=1 Tax=Candidatus Halobonum tyrrellensis G22 TaxID=1324957 RepID=V4GV81_9EURY|nr:hypothetical protein [Candidatus Halobonum tyrrellensis]ESP89066.1 hypothetical protein K933_05663 [Candidatus Halobonum tyrrellensis G22]
MVGPSLTDDERDSANRRLQVGFVLLVGASGGLVALGADATPVQLAAGVAAGLVLGVGLLWFVLRTFREVQPARGPRR